MALMCIGANCTNTSYTLLNSTTEAPAAGSGLDWLMLSQYVHYANPILIGIGLFFAIFNTVVVMSHARISNDSYMMGMTIATALLLICKGLLHFPDYVGYSEAFQYMKVYILGGSEWFGYTTIWVVILASIERCANMTPKRTHTFCTSFQACVTTIMVFLVCMVSTLPRYWEYEVVEVIDPVTNHSVTRAVQSDIANSVEFSCYYFWYALTLQILLPFPMMLILLIILCHLIHKFSKKKMPSYRRDSTVLLLNRKVAEELKTSRLLVALMLLYIFLTGPYTIFTALLKIFPDLYDPEAETFALIRELLLCLFYLDFCLHIVLFLCYSKTYRLALTRLCCDRCRNPYGY